nr:protein like COV 2 [Tanacetum cinerariifolium]
MLVPGYVVGKVMGRGRANVVNIRKILGASVKISDNKSSRGRVDVILRKPEQKRTTESLIQTFIMATYMIKIIFLVRGKEAKIIKKEWTSKFVALYFSFYDLLYNKLRSFLLSTDQNTTAFKEVAIIRHPRLGEYAFGFITSSVVLQRENGDCELCSVYVPTKHLYIGDVFQVNSEEITRPNLSIREGI